LRFDSEKVGEEPKSREFGEFGGKREIWRGNRRKKILPVRKLVSSAKEGVDPGGEGGCGVGKPTALLRIALRSKGEARNMWEKSNRGGGRQALLSEKGNTTRGKGGGIIRVRGAEKRTTTAAPGYERKKGGAIVCETKPLNAKKSAGGLAKKGSRGSNEDNGNEKSFSLWA